jgi:hypothetical protein
MNQHQAWSPVIYADRCRGFIARCRDGFETFSIDEQPLGTFRSETEAIAALLKGGANANK